MAINLKQSNELRNFPIYILGGLISAILFASIPTGNVMATIAMYFSPLPLIYLGITAGFYPILIAVITGVITLSFKSLSLSVGFLIMDSLPSLLLSILFLAKDKRNNKWLEIGYILTGLSLFVSLLVALLFSKIGYLLSTNPELSIIGSLQTYLDNAILKFPKENQKTAKLVFENILPLLPFSIGISIMARIILSAFTANWIAKKHSKSIREDVNFINLNIPKWSLGLVAIIGLISLINNEDISYIARNAGFIMLTPLFFIGLNVIHQNVKRTKFPRLILTIFYIILTFSGYMAILFLSGLGIFDYILSNSNISSKKFIKEKK